MEDAIMKKIPKIALGAWAWGNDGTSGGSPIGRSGENLASQAGSGNWLSGGRLDADISESGIQDWINNMN